MELGSIVVISTRVGIKVGVVEERIQRLKEGKKTENLTVSYEYPEGCRERIELDDASMVEVKPYNTAEIMEFVKTHAGFAWAEAESKRLTLNEQIPF